MFGKIIYISGAEFDFGRVLQDGSIAAQGKFDFTKRKNCWYN
jgi:hypothetical protein